jgi:hypothetical protein
MLEEFLHAWEFVENGCIRIVVCGEKIIIDQTLITQQFGVNVKGTIIVVNTLVKEVQVAFKKHIWTGCICQQRIMECNLMKEEYHVKFTTIIQIIYQQERLPTLVTTLALLSIWLTK